MVATGCSRTPHVGIAAGSSFPPASPASTIGTVTGVPSIESPLDIDSFVTEPCHSLTNEQITKYLGEETKTNPRKDGAAGPACSWRSDMHSDAKISITYPQVTDEGLTAIYRNKNEAAYFTELPDVDGYPAVASSMIDARDEGECHLLVGTSNTSYVSVRAYLGDGSVGKVDPCEAAHEVATAVIGNIKAANGGK
ncbi:DUF3558 domain-containing protein [Saccharomonospora xinjiangensis]|uniref:DUF3558 domain-containing protein n=1 Tax=Saccharomonospora xinjiangensis TaxID=75294 RepID=UPI001E2B18BB|nr:DUF3558 domain-containing protein [Saccharomonospora xinjiangensis]